MKIFKYDIRLNTIFHKHLPKIDDRHGVYFITGRQGTGKTYYAIYYLLQQDLTKLNKIYTNILSLNIPPLREKICYFTKVEEIYMNTEEDCIFILDEIARKYDKNSKTDTQLYAWLNQSRKKKRIVLLITQEWKELPMWIRRPAKFMFKTQPTFILGWFGWYTTIVGDAENMVLDKDTMEWECPPIKHIIYKRMKKVADCYDTFEAINNL